MNSRLPIAPGSAAGSVTLASLAGLLGLLGLVSACSSESPSASPSDAADASLLDGGADDASPPDGATAADTALPPIDAAGIVAARPYTLHVPASWDGGAPSAPAPLVVMFHGYSASGALEELLFRMSATSDAHGFLYAYGDGLTDSQGNKFWNATDACCNFDKNPVDDVAYFDAIVQDVASKYPVDRKRVYAIGHSNGGFMSHRLACERSTEIAAIMALAGDQYLDASKCNPAVPVSVLQVHGDADKTIYYNGGSTDEGAYPSAHASVATWAAKDGCTGPLAQTGTKDLDSTLAGSETKIEAYGGCPSGIDVQLWTIQGSDHIPNFNYPTWGDSVWAFLSAHAR